MKRGDFVIIEGMDGSGKTTVGDQLAKQLGYQFFDSLPTPYREHHADFRDRLSRDGFHLYMMSMLKTMSETIGAMRDDGKGVVMSRYYQTTVSYHTARNLFAGKKDYLKIDLDPLKLEKPSHAFFLHVEEPERVRRLQSRGALSVEDQETLNSGFREILVAEYAKHGMQRVDATVDGPKEVANKLMALVKAPAFKAKKGMRPA
jgi:dTMP kinase